MVVFSVVVFVAGVSFALLMDELVPYPGRKHQPRSGRFPKFLAERA